MLESPLTSSLVGRCFNDVVPVVKGNSSGSSDAKGSPVGAERVITGAPLRWLAAACLMPSTETGFRNEEPRKGKRMRAASAGFSRVDGVVAIGEAPDSGVSTMLAGLWRGGKGWIITEAGASEDTRGWGRWCQSL